MQGETRNGQNGVDGDTLVCGRAGDIVIDSKGFGSADEGDKDGERHEKPHALFVIYECFPGKVRVQDEKGDEIKTGEFPSVF